jgi:3-phenylpropionate/cinnamic acid dioxygenase small subunit
MHNQWDAAHLVLRDKVKRVRTGIKASFGDDSSTYEMVSGARMSERKTCMQNSHTGMEDTQPP